MAPLGTGANRVLRWGVGEGVKNPLIPKAKKNGVFKARGYRHAHKMDESRALIHSIYNYYNNVNLYCH